MLNTSGLVKKQLKGGQTQISATDAEDPYVIEANFDKFMDFVRYLFRRRVGRHHQGNQHNE